MIDCSYHADAEGDPEGQPKNAEEEEAVDVGLGELVVPAEGDRRLVRALHGASHPDDQAQVDQDSEEHRRADYDRGAYYAAGVYGHGEGFSSVYGAQVWTPTEVRLSTHGRRGYHPYGQHDEGHLARRQYAVPESQNGLKNVACESSICSLS